MKAVYLFQLIDLVTGHAETLFGYEPTEDKLVKLAGDSVVDVIWEDCKEAARDMHLTEPGECSRELRRHCDYLLRCDTLEG